MNWDSAVPVLTWIASREDCDAATAASIAWMADPAYYADTLRSGRTRLPSEEWDLLQLILGRFRRGAYRRTELGLFAGHEHQPARYLAALGGDPDPLDLPASFFAPASGRPPRVPDDCDAGRSAQVWDLLAALGTYAGRRPA